MNKIVLQTNVERTPKVMQVEAMFDIPQTNKSRTEIADNIPDLSKRQWNIGLIVGASGTGKSTIARKHFGDLVDDNLVWHENKSIIDCFPEKMGVKDVALLLSSTGIASPPTWLRPFHTLSNGEKFRVTMARLLAENPELIVVDEFTSVVDRTVAKIGSSALAKTVRKNKQQFVAVSCHYDIVEWLAPDWIYEPATGSFRWESLQRPKIDITIRRCNRSAWDLFARHHYLNHDNVKSWSCYVAFIEDNPVGFCSVLVLPHPKLKNARRIARTVVLPDYQGIGIGGYLRNVVASAYVADGKQVYGTTSHPAVINAYNNSPLWAMVRKPSRVQAVGKTSALGQNVSTSRNRITASFKFIGKPDYQALKLLHN
jgi:ABC-type lipoprotein export system ATPase subunit/predicted acetyltransferase